MNALRILILAPYIPREGYHAGGKRMFENIRWLAAFGHRIRLVAIYHNEEERACATALTSMVEKLFLFPAIENKGQGDPFYLLPVNYRTPQLVACIDRQATDCDLIFAEFHLTAHLVPRLRSCPAVLFHHEVQTTTLLDYASRHGWFSRKRWRYFYNAARNYQVERDLLARFDAVIAVTDEDLAILRRIDPRANLHLSKFGVSLAELPPCGEPENPHGLMYVGYFNHPPNIDAARSLALDILPRLVGDFPDIDVSLIGAAPTPEILALEGPHVHVTGRVPDLRPYYENAALFVAPITSGRGIRGKIIETMAQSKAVVATPLALHGIAAEDGVHVAIAETPEQFAEKIAYLLTHREVARRMGERARELMAGFDWQNRIREMEAILKETVERYRSRHAT
jgi:glycosyltransferase involved in cell wall biosynthesis